MNRKTLTAAMVACCGIAAAVNAQQIGPVIITEIHYNPHNLPSGSSEQGMEFVEVYNPTNGNVDISGWYLQDEDGRTTPIAAGTILAPGEAFVITSQFGPDATTLSSLAAWRQAWGTGYRVGFVDGFSGPWTSDPTIAGLNNLANGPTATNEVLTLRDAGGQVVDEANYQAGAADWPTSNNAGSIYLLPLFFNVTDNDQGAAWRLASNGVDGNFLILATNEIFTGPNSVASPGRVPQVGPIVDCNSNGVPDAVDIFNGSSTDCDNNQIPDECQSGDDCDGNGILDVCELGSDWRMDRNLNGIIDSCDIASGFSQDVNGNGIVDEFENTPSVLISEIMYNPTGTEEIGEFVEIYNFGATPVDIGGWTLADIEGDSPSAAIPAGTTINPGEVVMLVPTSDTFDLLAEFRTAWGLDASAQIIGLAPWGARANGATFTNEVLALLDSAGIPVDVANYENDSNGWPNDDGVSSIYLLSTGLDKDSNDTGANWRLSIASLDGARFLTETANLLDPRNTGSPGVVHTAAPQRPSGEVIITEIMYGPNSTGNRAEWIEIYNTTNLTIDISGWFLSDEDGFTTPIAAGSTLAPNEVAVLAPFSDVSPAQAVSDFQAAWCRGYQIFTVFQWASGQGQYNLLNLSNSPDAGNELLTLRNAAGNAIDQVNYDDDGIIWPTTGNTGAGGTAWSIYLLPGSYDSVSNDSGLNWAASAVGFEGARQNTATDVFAGNDLGSPGYLDGVTGEVDCTPGGPICPPCAADFDQSGGVDGDDIGAFFNAWQAGESCGDVDQSGGVDGDDIGAFFTVWQAGGC